MLDKISVYCLASKRYGYPWLCCVEYYSIIAANHMGWDLLTPFQIFDSKMLLYQDMILQNFGVCCSQNKGGHTLIAMSGFGARNQFVAAQFGS